MPKLDTPTSTPLYCAEQTRRFDQRAIHELGIPGYELMCRAADAAWQSSLSHWPAAQHFLVLCGAGNNAGDGYVFGRLALASGKQVTLIWLAEPTKLNAEALNAWQDYQLAGGTAIGWTQWSQQQASVTAALSGFDVIVDALFGTGLRRPATGAWAQAIEHCNQQRQSPNPAAVLSLDIPSGLHADTGQILGAAIQADRTLTFIADKLGLHCGHGPDLCGELELDALALPNSIFSTETAAAQRLEQSWLKQHLTARPRQAHKGNCGHVLLIGGDHGMGGAIQLASAACLRSGAGLTTVATRGEHITAQLSSNPEAMSIAVDNGAALTPLLNAASVIAIGPGLGQSKWAQQLLERAYGYCCESEKPLVVDADALNLIAAKPFQQQPKHWLLTPHPGEAARLLGCTTSEVQSNRRQAVLDLQAKYQATVILKGDASLIAGNNSSSKSIKVALCPFGNPGMASGGMGDVLTGIAAGFIAQSHGDSRSLSMNLFESACSATLAHALAADIAAQQGQRGLLARDVIHSLRSVVN